MTRTFIQTNEFFRRWQHLGFTDDHLRKLEREIMQNPQTGAIMRGTGGLRKLRFAYPHSGKRGSVRVCYVDFALYQTTYLITVYGKNEKDNLSPEERNTIHRLIHLLEQSLSNRKEPL